jgi:hypothetical protein
MEMDIFVGDALVAGVQRTLALAFDDVVLLPSPNPTDTQGIEAVVTPEITSMDNVLVGFPPFSKWESRLVCKWTVTTLNGEVVYLNTIVGEGRYEALTTAFSYHKKLAQSMIPAVQDHFRKLLADLTERRWWEQQR